ncbi:MAG: hypothetical protein IKP00_04165 [Victivallales bacterium]|nr:hypothetical protein [Victivallales bacterium]
MKTTKNEMTNKNRHIDRVHLIAFIEGDFPCVEKVTFGGGTFSTEEGGTILVSGVTFSVGGGNFISVG